MNITVLLRNDGVNADCGLADLTVANDEFALAAANRNHRVDGFDPGLDGSVHILATHYPRSNPLNGAIAAKLDWAFAVDGFAECIDYAANQPSPNRDGSDAPGTAHGHPLGNFGVFTHNDDADAAAFQVEGNTNNTVCELNQFL